MRIRFGNLILETDLKITEFIERGIDRDFFLENDRKVIKTEGSGIFKDIEFTDVSKILIRASGDQSVSECTVHFLKSHDLHSSSVSFILDIKGKILSITETEGRNVLKVLSVD